jgi:DNA-binding NarL/FixJ family response regulator
MPPYFEHIFKDLENVSWVGHAYDMAAAEELMRREQPEVVFLDICLKEGNGFTLLKNIKRKHPGVYVFMLSNNKNALYTQKSQEQGALFLIDKTNEFHLIPFFLNALKIVMNTGQRIKQFDPQTIK